MICATTSPHACARAGPADARAVRAGLTGHTSSVIMTTLKGGNFANGACPCASSRSVMPTDQMSADRSYELCSITSGAIQQGVPTNVLRGAQSAASEPPRFSAGAETPKSARKTCPFCTNPVAYTGAPQSTSG